VALAVGNALRLYRYDLELQPKSDVKGYEYLSIIINKYRQQNTYKLLQKFSLESQTINTFTCANGFVSSMSFCVTWCGNAIDILLCAGSNRSISVYDAAAHHCVTTFEDAHAKPVHTIVMAANCATASSVPRSMVMSVVVV